jgi:hypothetical protein
MMTTINDLITGGYPTAFGKNQIEQTKDQKLGILLHKRLCSLVYTTSAYYKLSPDANGVILSSSVHEDKVSVTIKFLRSRKRITFMVSDGVIEVKLRVRTQDIVKDFLDLYLPVKIYNETFADVKKKLYKYIHWGITPLPRYIAEIRADALDISKFSEGPRADILYYGTVRDVVFDGVSTVNIGDVRVGRVSFVEDTSTRYLMEVPPDYEKYIKKGCIGIFDHLGRYKFYTLRGARGILNLDVTECKRILKHIKEHSDV